MPKLEIRPEELYGREQPLRPVVGASLAEWRSHWGATPRPAHRIEGPSGSYFADWHVKVDGKWQVRATPAFVERVRELAQTHSDTEMARILKCARSTIQRARYTHGIAPGGVKCVGGRPVVPAPPECPAEYIEDFHRKVYGYGQETAIKWLRNRMRGRKQRGAYARRVAGVEIAMVQGAGK